MIKIILTLLSSAAFASQVCKAPTDCHGAVPRYCVSCSNGKGGGCAHWSCVNNACQIATCDIESKRLSPPQPAVPTAPSAAPPVTGAKPGP